jgi:cytochrome P450
VSAPPGPRLPAIVQTVRWARDPIGFLGACRRRYGDVFSVSFVGFGDWVYVCDAETIAAIFQADPDKLAGEARDMLEPVVGRRSVLILDGEEHRRERRLLLPSFQGNHVRRYGDLMREVAEEEIARWPLGRPFPLRPRMQDVTLEVILRAVFGFEQPQQRAELHRRITRLLEVAAPVLLVPALMRDLGRFSPGGRLARARAAVDELVYAQIRARRAAAGSDEHEDVLTLLLGARDEDGRALDDEALRDELMTLLLAGHETTATGLAWAFERLVRHPAAMERLLAELDAGEDGYLDAVIRETLRVRPVLFDTARKAVEPTEIGGWRLPADTMIAPALALVHLDPEFHPDPEAYRPERYADGSPPPRTWVPFGGGPRSCLGAGFALFEMRVVIRTVLSALRLRPARAADEAAKLRNVTVVPARGAEVIAERRAA